MTLIKSSATLNLNGLTHNDLLGVVQTAIRDAQLQLQQFAQRPDFREKMVLAFDTSPADLQSAWANGVVIVPEIEIRSSSEINGANGAFAGATNTIYLAQEFLSANANNLDAVVGVLLEEYGHFLDYSINQTDSPGDEGAIFAALVQGESLSDAELAQLKVEEDYGLINLKGQIIRVEQNTAILNTELTEGNANYWNTFASDGANATVSNDTNFVKIGSQSLKFVTESGFDTGIKYQTPEDAYWDLTGITHLEFWAYAINNTPIGFQGNQPVIILNSPNGSFRYEPQGSLGTMPLNRWIKYSLPLTGDSEWSLTTTDNPTLADIKSLEIHQDTWDYGFTVYYDGLQFLDIDGVVPINITAPDLQITAATAPTTAVLGETVALTWTVANKGTVTANSDWYDRIYLSSDQTYNSGDVQVTQESIFTQTPLAKDGSYTISKNVVLPSFTPGNQYLLFVADWFQSQGETDETNSTKAVAISLNAPDLIITNASAPDSVTVGQTFSVSWDVKNQGTFTANLDWSDRIVVSTDQILDNNDTSVTNVWEGELTPLAAAGTYTKTLNVTLPNTATGDRYLLFKVDGYDDQGETDETNNVKAVAINISGADLQVTAATAPTTAVLGETIELTWTVANKGTVTANSDWYDTVYLSSDQTYDFDDVYVAEKYISTETPLAKDGSYTISKNVVLPSFTPGNQYLLFVTDSTDSQGETNGTNNTKAVAINIAAPDLQVTAATAPTTAVLGETVALTWTVANKGTGTANSNWYDEVYLSSDQTYDFDDVYVAGEYISTQTPLAKDGSYTISKNFVLPNFASGNQYLLFVADGSRDQGETDETNNTKAVAISLNAPDLIITNASAPDSVTVGQTFSVSWDVKNQGTFTANLDWYDLIVVSTDQIFGNNDDTYVTEVWEGALTPLAAAGTYTKTLNVTLPSTATGDRYLLFKVDGSDYQAETDETNNVKAVAINITAPDLQVTTATAPTTAVLGETVELTWTVGNKGTGTATRDWYDRVYLSSDQTFNFGDVPVTSEYISTQTPLAKDGSYTISKNVVFPSFTPGNQYLLFVADDYRYQGETNENNNVRAVAITLSAPDLIVSDTSAPVSGGLGSTVNVSWTVKNQGTVTASADWSDYIYWSSNDTYDSADTLITSISAAAQTPVVAGGSYSKTQNITLPNQLGFIGNGYLIFRADGSQNQGETNNNNNDRAVAFRVDAPDLIVSNASAPESVSVGATFSLSWNVKNQGTVAANADWYDSFYVSSDQIFDSSDQYLTSRSAASNTPLAANGTYTATQNVTLPNTATGDRYLLFVTDRYFHDGSSFNNLQGETDETNNVRAVPINISASDLQVTAANAPTSAILGETVALTWTVANQGTGTATRDWYDRVYLSNNQTLDGSDVQVTSEYISTQTPLAAGTNYTISKNVVLPSFSPGNQYLLFVADRDNIQAETNENNNVRAVAIALGATNLVISNPTAPASAGIGETIDLSWTVTNNGNFSASADWLDRVYISENQTLDNSDTLLLEINTGNNSPLLQGSSYTIEQSATIPNTDTEVARAANRYLLFVANANDAQGENSRTDNIVAVPFEVKSPNLAFKEVNAPQSAVLGESIDLSWIIENKGTGTALANWFDTIYISDDNKIDYGVDTYVTRFDQAAVSPLAAGNEYNNAVNITLPLRTNPGDRYLLFLADGKYPQPTIFFRVDYPGDYQAETNEADNLYAVPISLIAPELVDLTVSGIVAPSEVISGQSIEISWFITNEGSDPITGTWNDKVFLSGNQTVGGDRFLKTFNFTGTIGAGETIERKQLIEIPIDISGEHWFVVQTDADDQKIEYFAENDNIRIDDTRINIILSPFPNLQVTAVNPPTTAFSSQQTVVEWTVTNNGNAPTNAPFWYDRVWLSKDNILDGTDINLGEAVNPNYLRIGESYSNQLTVTLPQGIDDNYYFIVKTDVNNNVYEFQKENDNVGVGSATDVQLTPPPDLQITSVTAPNNAFSGRFVSLTWTVKNKGIGATLQSQWYDKVFLSSDQTLDGGDIFLNEFEHRGVLNADGSYTQTQSVGLPVDITGEYYFIVKADGRETVYEQAFESNNTGFDPTPTKIVLTPPSDIEVKSVNIPNTVAAGHNLTIGTEISVIGDIFLDDWVDAFYLSKDLEFDPETDIYLGDYQIRYPEIYEEKTLPDNIPTKVFTVGEDGGQLFFNIQAVNPLTAIPTQDYFVTYFKDTWSNSSYMNGLTIIDDNLAENSETVEIIAMTYGSKQLTTRFIVNIIDNDTTGIPNISVGDVTAHEFEGQLYFPIILDKASTEAITVTYTAEDGTAQKGSDYFRYKLGGEVDLQISGSVTFEPGEVVKNIPILIKNDLESEGEETFNLVITNTTSGVIADNTGTATILANTGYSIGASYLALPENLRGDYYVVAVADNNNTIYELDNENNIRFSPEPVTIVTPGEDLIVSSLTANKTTVNRGGYLYLDWTVTNTGTNSTIRFDNFILSYQPIFDKIVISKDNILGNNDDIELLTTNSKPDVLPENTLEFIKESNGSYVYQKNGNFYQALLQPQDFYQRNFEPVLIPFNLTAGQYNLFVTTDTKQTIYEGNETNNYAVIPLTITSDIADLQVTNINIFSDTNIKSGESLTFTWTVNNFGTNQTSSQTWQDQIYLSKDKVISNDDILLTNQNHNNGLGGGDEYTKLTSNLIPINTVGDYYVLVRTDNNNSVQESSNENNVLASTNKISITLSDVPDLVIESVNAPATAISGQSFNINWQIANNGTTTDDLFYTSFYLSLDQNLDRNSDVYLGTNIQAIGNQNTLTWTFDIPRGLSGRYYAFAVVDSKNEIYERDGELNNTNYDPLSVEIILPPPADLVVTAINIPNQVITLGDDVGFSYTIKNQGTDAALGNWFDSVYLSKDQTWDINDVLVNKFNHQGNIPVGGSYQGFAGLSRSTPVTPGDYYVLVRSDIRNQVAETNDNNNLGVSLGKVTIDVEALTLNTPTSDIINQGEAVYYRVDVAAGESLLFNFDGQYTLSDYGFTEFYVSYGKMPTRNNFDFIYQVPLEADQQILVPTTEAGTYYVMAYGNTVPEYTGKTDGFNYTIEAKTIDFAVLDTDFGVGGTAGNRTIEINGNKFDPNVTVSLAGENGFILPAKTYYRINENKLFATFDLTQSAPGVYDVVLDNGEGKTAFVDDGLEVVAGGGANIGTYIQVPDAIARPVANFPFVDKLSYQFTVSWYNDGINDAPPPLLYLNSNDEFGDSMSEILAGNGRYEQTFLGIINEEGPRGIILPGQSKVESFTTRNSPMPNSTVRSDIIYQFYDLYSNPSQLFDWESIRRDIRPLGVTDSEFEAVFQQIIKQVGTTNQDFTNMLARNGELLPPELGDATDLLDLLALEYEKAKAALGLGIAGKLVLSKFDADISGQAVEAVNQTTNESFSATSLNDGTFVIYGVTPGTYTINFEGGVITNAQELTVTAGQSLTDVVLNVVAGATLQGAILHGSTGLLLPNAEILITPDSEGASDSQLITSDAQGRYVIPHLAVGTYNLLVRKEGLANYRTQIEVKTLTDKITVNLNPVNGGQLTGTLRDGVSNSLIANGQGIVTKVGEEQPIESFFIDENGNFTVTGLAPGQYVIRVESSGYSAAIVENVSITAGATTQINPSLARSAGLTGKVVDGEGDRVTGVDVGLYNSSGELQNFATVNAQGVYSFNDLAAGNYQVKVLNGSRTLTSVDVQVQGGMTTTAPDATLPVISQISGTVFNNSGVGLADASVALYTADGEQLISTLANGEGKFSFGILKAGTYKLTALSENGIYNVAEVVIPSGGGDITDISFNPGTRTVQGQVLSPTGAILADVPVTVFLVNALGSQSVQTTTNASGQFTVSGLIAGTYQVLADPDTDPNDFAPGTQTVTVGGTDVTGVTVATLERFTWQGIVTSADGTPIQEVTVLIYKAGTNQLAAFRTTDAEGKVNANDLASGLYDVDLIANGYALKRLTNVDLSGGNGSSTFALETGNTSLSGKVLSDSGDSLSDELVFAYDTTGRLIGTAQTGADGSYQFTSLPAKVVSLEVSVFGAATVTSAPIDLGANSSQSGINLTMSTEAINQSTINTEVGQQVLSLSSGMIEPLATRSDSWIDDAWFRKVERLEEPEKPEGPPECKKDEKLYQKALLSWEIMRNQFELAKETQNVFAYNATGLQLQLLVDGLELTANTLSFAAGTGKLRGSLDTLKGLLSSKSIKPLLKDKKIRLDFVADAWGLYDATKDIAAGLTSAFKEGLAEPEPVAQGVASAGALAVQVYEEVKDIKGQLERIDSLINPGVGVYSILVDNPSAEEYQKQLATKAKLLQGIGNALGVMSLALEAKQIWDNFGKTVRGITQLWVEFINELTEYEESVQKAKEIIEQYEQQKTEIGELKAVKDSYSTREGNVIFGNVLRNDIKDNCEQETQALLKSAARAFGDLNLDKNGNFSFKTKDPDYVGTRTFEYDLIAINTEIINGVKKEVTRSGGTATVTLTFTQDCLDKTDPKSCHVQSKDPNDIIGPDGFGEENWVTANQPLNYTIRFENDPELATAPVQTVRITQKLDSDLDLRTFRLGKFGFGEFVFEVPNNQAVYQDRLDLTATLGVYVDVFAGIDITTGEAFWELTAIDPETGEVPISVLEGFLPPNEDGLEGQGFVTYTIRAKGNVPTGTVIDAQADIIFDTNEPIITPPIFNTLDAGKPTSTITALPSNTEATEFVVQWTGEDTADGSGLASYTIYVSTNGGAFTPWLSETTDTEAIFTGEVGKTYEFYSVAIDNAGNRQNLPLEAQATIFIDGEITGSIGNFIWLDNNANGIQDTGESGLANVTVTLFDNTNNAIATTTSDADGSYRFTNIAIGDYTLKVTAPATYLFSPQNQGTNDTLDSDFNPNNGLTATFTLTRDGNITLDAGLYQTATINGQVWNDIKGNGIKDAQESGLKDWTVYLDANNNGEYNSGEITTVTDTQGNYRFSDLIPGTYTVAQVLQDNWRQTYPVITTTGANIPLSIPTLELISPSDNQVQLNFSTTEYIVEETGNAITEVIVTRTGDTSSSVSVTLTLSDGTAEGCGCVPSSTRTDFNYRSILITFAENEVSKVIPVENALLANPNAIRIRNDDKVEGEEYFTINLTNPTGGATIGTQGIAKVTIIDDEAPSNIRITESASSAIAPNNNNVSSPSETLSNSNANSGNTNAINLINLDDFWADSRFANIKGQGYTTVIIDTGADLNHPLFGPDNDNNGIADRIIYQYDFADNDNDAGDRNNHGSHITSIAAQIAPDANLIVLKVFKDNGSGSFATLEKALQWVNNNATTYNVASVNLSLGDSQNWTTEVPRYGIGDELAAIASQNILIAAAAGNSFYTFNSTPGLAYPAADPNTISVGAVWADSFGSNKTFSSGATDYTTGGDAIASFSQRHPSLLDVFAPGIFIAGANATGGTQTMGGTSQATPFISGIAVLGQQIAQEKLGRELTPTEFRTLLNNTSDFINDGDDENDNVTNTGLNYSRINLLALAEGILNLNSQAPNPGNSNTNINSSDDPLYLPSGSVKLTHTVTLTTGQIATDINFGNQRLNNAPILGNAIADQTVTEDTIFTFIIPENTFTDVDAGDILSYTATLETGLVLPSWLTFDAVTRTFSGTPTNSEVSSLNLKITATDKAGVTVNDTFVITVENINDAPTLANEIADQNAKQGTAFNFQIPTNTFTDIDDGDVLTYSATLENGNALPSWLIFNPTTRTFSGTPTNDNVGNLNVKVAATDTAGATVSDIFVIAVENVNDAPTLANEIADQNAKQDNVFNFQIPTNTFTDIDAGDVLTYSATLENGNALPSWLTFNSTTRTFSGTPTNDNVGNLNIKAIATDKAGVTVSDILTITVENINDSPTLSQAIADQNAKQGTAFNFQIPTNTFTDIDAGDVLTYSATLENGNALPSWLTFNPTTRTFSGTPTNDNVGNLNVKVAATDKAGATVSDIFTITVENVNDAPIVANLIADQNAKQGTAFNFQIPTNTFTDIDAGDVLTYSATLENGNALPSWLTFNSTTRTFSGTPTNDNVGNLNVKAIATDKAGVTVSDIFTITIENVNDAPTLANTIADQNAKQGTAFNFQIPTNTFTDIDAGDVLTYSATLENGNALPSWLTFNSTTRTFSGTPTNDNVGSLNVKVAATDKAGATVSDTFVITVENVNDAPALGNAIADQNTKQDNVFNFQIPTNTFTDIDAGDVLTYSATLENGDALPSWLTFNSVTRTFSGTPTNDNIGNLNVKAIATDKAEATVSDIFTITVENVNDAPTLANAIADQNAKQDNVFNFQIPTNTFTDIDAGDVLSYSATLENGNSLPSWLTFNSTTRTFSGTPTNDHVGNLNVKAIATDKAGATVSDVFVIAVENINDAPIVANPIADQNAKQGSAFNFQIPANAFTDIDAGDVLTYSTTLENGNALPTWLTFNSTTRTFSGTPTNDNVGSLNVKVAATDKSGATVSDIFIIAVENVNDAPIVANLIADQNAKQGTAFNFQIPTNTFTDIDAGDVLTYSATLENGNALPSWLTFNSVTRTFSGTPTNDNVGNLNVKMAVTDKAGASVNDIFTLGVEKIIDNQSTTVGTPGDDKLIATPGGQFDGQNNIVFTGAGKDEVDLSTVSAFPNSGNNIVDLGSGEDTIFVNKGDRVFGSDGNDTFDARDSQGNNRMSGGAGNDTFYLGSNDRALGGDGNDIFRVSLGGGNLISGGAGADQFWIVNAELPKAANTILDFQLGTDVIGISGAVSLGITSSTLKLNQVGDDTAIIFNNQTLATLTGIQASNLNLTDSKQFVFA